jgi:hypothetical protein
MLHPFAYKNARIQARFHVQVELVSVPEIARTPSNVHVGARVIRVFRGAPDLRIGDLVEFELSVCRQDDDIADGGTSWTDSDALRRARFMEVYLNGEPPNTSMALGESRIIETPSEFPALPCTPADTLEEFVDVLAGGRFRGRTVSARIGDDGGQSASMRLENALQHLNATPLEHGNPLELKAGDRCQFRVGDDIVTVHRIAGAFDIEGLPAIVLRVMHAAHGMPIGIQTVVSYATTLTRAGENEGALLMLDLAILHRDRLAPYEGRPNDLVEILATAFMMKGIVASRLGDDATARAAFQQSEELLSSGGTGNRGRNFIYPWVVDWAKEEERAGQYRSAAALFGHAVTFLQQLVQMEGKAYLRPELAKVLVDQGNALLQLGRADAAVRLCNQAIEILEPMAQGQQRLGLDPHLARANDVKNRAGLGRAPQSAG